MQCICCIGSRTSACAACQPMNDENKESEMYEGVLAFWFEEIQPQTWWSTDPAFDEQVRQRFLALLDRAAQGELYMWRSSPEGRLAEIIVLDQFSRNIH